MMPEVAKQLNGVVLSVIGQQNIELFEKAYLTASAIGQLKEALTPEYMKPLMALQGNKLGFRTDKDRDGGYPEAVVKNCLIEAVLTGVQPVGNQFNIIAGNFYITKEGCGYLLSKIPGLSYSISHQLPRIKDQSAAVVMEIRWTYKGTAGSKDLDIPIKVNSMMGADAVIGKAMRKARFWLYTTITGTELPEGDVMDVEARVISSKAPVTSAVDTREEEVLKAALVEIEKADTLEKLEAVKAKMGSEILIQLEPQIEAHRIFIVKANEQA